MKKKQITVTGTLVLVALLMVLSGCKKDEETEDCITRTKRDQYYGYEVWAGDTILWGTDPYRQDYDPMAYYNIDRYFTFIGSGTTTQHFSTGNHKYYVLAAPWYCCIDAIQFDDSTYYSQGSYTMIGGLAEHPPGGLPLPVSRLEGMPDGISGNLGYKDLCKEPGDYGGFITDDATITSRGGGLTIYVVDNCN